MYDVFGDNYLLVTRKETLSMLDMANEQAYEVGVSMLPAVFSFRNDGKAVLIIANTPLSRERIQNCLHPYKVMVDYEVSELFSQACPFL